MKYEVKKISVCQQVQMDWIEVEASSADDASRMVQSGEGVVGEDLRYIDCTSMGENYTTYIDSCIRIDD